MRTFEETAKVYATIASGTNASQNPSTVSDFIKKYKGTPEECEMANLTAIAEAICPYSTEQDPLRYTVGSANLSSEKTRLLEYIKRNVWEQRDPLFNEDSFLNTVTVTILDKTYALDRLDVVESGLLDKIKREKLLRDVYESVYRECSNAVIPNYDEFRYSFKDASLEEVSNEKEFKIKAENYFNDFDGQALDYAMEEERGFIEYMTRLRDEQQLEEEQIRNRFYDNDMGR
jgi:hypothetical protein